MTENISEGLVEPIESVTYRVDCVEDPDSSLREWILQQGWSCRSWTDAPATTHAPHDHPYAHRVLAVSGWIEFTVKNQSYRLTSGDALDLPARVGHGADSAPDQPTEYWLLRPE